MGTAKIRRRHKTFIAGMRIFDEFLIAAPTCGARELHQEIAESYGNRLVVFSSVLTVALRCGPCGNSQNQKAAQNFHSGYEDFC